MEYTAEELRQFSNGISISLLSKCSSQHWRYDEETQKQIDWLEVLHEKVKEDIRSKEQCG